MPEHIAEEILDQREPGQTFESAALMILIKGLQGSSDHGISDSLLAELVKATESLPSGVQFVLSEIYSDWNKIDANLKRVLGKKYRHSVESSGLAQWVRRRSDNHAVYFKS